MPNTLALVTCTHQLEAALLRSPGSVPSLMRLTGGAPRSTFILAAVDLLLAEAAVERSAVGRILVTRGPGSFTGIRAGLATAEGLATALDIPVAAYPSLVVQAWRCDEHGTAWTAQPGRRGEVYAQRFAIGADQRDPLDDIRVVPVGDLPSDAPWIAAETVDLAGAPRAATARSAAEALLTLAGAGVPSGPPVPLYVEGPPVDQRSR